MLHLGPSTPADIAMDQLTRLAATVGATPDQVARVTLDTLNAWHKLPDGRQHAMELRGLLSAELMGAIERVDAAKMADRIPAQAVADLLRAGVATLGARLARW